ncbi:MarR family winged helix-turn-helix transcriptional regulator [Cryptosporangium minutisporangium]|uniref:HTH marR-type domain-containing protein n=1 Tax=Cryptosporangium minutisporangium TaxID=113569 RepID=A0ABP6SS96_9ACTN
MVDSTEVAAAAARVQQATARLTWWTSRGDVRRRLLGAAGKLSPNDAWLVRTIVAAGTVRVSDAARMQGVDKSTISPQLRRLEAHGLLTREPDPSDGRATLLRATDEGCQWQREFDAGGAAVFADVLSEWSPDDVATLATLLTRFTDQLTLDGVMETPGSGGSQDPKS